MKAVEVGRSVCSVFRRESDRDRKEQEQKKNEEQNKKHKKQSLSEIIGSYFF